MQITTFSNARARLAETLDRAEQGGEPILISRHGKKSAVLLSFGRYAELIDQREGFAARLAQWRNECVDLPDESPFDDVRPKESGRPFSW